MKTTLAEYGYFGNGYSYVKIQYHPENDKILVIFPPTQELIFPIRKNPWTQIKRYQSFIPKYIGTVYILGYTPYLTVETFLAEIAEVFGKFIRENIGPCDIVGISYGGAVAIPFAAKFPELTKKLLLIVASYAMSENGAILCNEIIRLTRINARLKVQIMLGTLVKNPLLAAYINLTTRLHWPRMQQYLNPPSTLINAYTHLTKYNFGLKKYIYDIQAPCLLIGATKDQFTSVELYQELADAIKESNLVLFNDATHAVPLEKLFKIKKLVKKFLKT